MKWQQVVLPGILFCLVSAPGYAEYTQEYCDQLAVDIEQLRAKISHWEQLVYSNQTLMVKFMCQPGEDLLSCGVRCHERTKASCLDDGTNVWTIMPENQLQGHPKYQGFKNLNQGRKDRVMGTRNGTTGLLPAWRANLKDMENEYKENCTGSVDSSFMGVDTNGLNWQ